MWPAGRGRARGRGLGAPALQAIQTGILRREPALDWAPGQRRRPNQLPPDIPEFTGRVAELATICDRLLGRPAPGDGAVPTVPTVLAIDGKPGIGKSALAVHAAHRMTGAFPDGALYVDLRGAQPQQLDVATAQGITLTAQDVLARPPRRGAEHPEPHLPATAGTV